MFKGSNNNVKKSVNLNSPDKLNRIVEGTVIEGSIVSESNIRIDGRVKGVISTKGRLVVGVSGSIEGEVVCQNAEIEGSVKGLMKVSELLSLKSTAKVEGDVVTDKLAIEPGALFTVTCSMGGADLGEGKMKKQAKQAV